MKFLLVLCLVALAAADEDKNQEKKSQSADTIQNTSNLSQSTSSLLNSQVFPPTTFSGPVSTLAYSGFPGSPIQTVNPDFFTASVPTVGNAPIQAFPVTRAVLPGTSAVVNGLQSAFPVTGGAFPAGISSQFPSIVGGLISTAGGVQDPNTANPNAGIASVPATAYRFFAPETLSGIPAQGLQAAQSIGIPAAQAFTSGVLTPVFQGQNIPTGVFQGQNIPFQPQNIQPGILKNPTGTTGNISSGPLTSVFRQ